MKKKCMHLSKILALFLIFTMIPVYSFGANKTLNDEDYNEFHIGQNYNVTLKIGTKPMFCCIECDYEENDSDLDDDSLPYLKTIKNSVPSVATVTGFDGDGSDMYFELKGKKAGKTKITVTDSTGKKSVFTVTVKAGAAKKSTIKSKNWIYKNTKTVKVVVTNVKKGDKIKLKIGNKVYTKKITKAAAKKTVKISIKKPGFYGKKYKLSLVRKSKTIAKSSKYVYLSDTVYVGYTKKKVKWLRYWKDPDQKNTSAYSEQWCYDWDGDGYYDAYLYFRNGKVTNWQIYDA